MHKLNAALERFYASIVVGITRTVHEVQRIRHWEDGGHRSVIALTVSSSTLIFDCTDAKVYAYAWYCNLIFTSIISFLSILILFPSSRRFFFLPPVQPTAPPEYLKFDDTAKLAEKRQDNPWGPAGSEAKATGWAQNIQEVIKSLTTPKGGEKEAKTITQGAQSAVEAHLQGDMKKREDAGNLDEGDAELKKKDKAVKLYAQPGLRFIGGLSDKWERVAK